MTQATLQADAFEQTYFDVENLINEIVWKFYRKYGGTFDEWKSEANLIFAKAFNRYEEGAGSFTTYLYIVLQGKLKNFLGDIIKQRQVKKIEDLSGDGSTYDVKDSKHSFYFYIDLVDEIRSEDAKTVVALIMDMPEELKSQPLHSGDSPKHMKKFLQLYLQKIGWTAKRVKESFQEIGEALYA